MSHLVGISELPQKHDGEWKCQELLRGLVTQHCVF